MKQLSQVQNVLFMAGAVLMVAGAACYLLFHFWSCLAYVVGVLLFVSMQYLASYEGNNFVIQRLRRQQMFGSVCLLISATALAMLTWDMTNATFFFRYVHHNEWIIFLVIGALLQLYTAFRIPAELKKEKQNR